VDLKWRTFKEKARKEARYPTSKTARLGILKLMLEESKGKVEEELDKVIKEATLISKGLII
jgi:hypothetical protein